MTEEEINALSPEKQELLFIVNTLTWVEKIKKEEPDRVATPEEWKKIRSALLMAMTYDPLFIADLLKGVEE